MTASASVTQVPTGPQAALGGNGVGEAATPEPLGELGLALKLADRLSSKVEAGKGGAAQIVLLALVAGALGGGGVVAVHASTGDGGVSKRLSEVEKQQVEFKDEQRLMSFNIKAIAKAVGADLLEE
jgi:hypothetical protein